MTANESRELCDIHDPLHATLSQSLVSLIHLCSRPQIRRSFSSSRDEFSSIVEEVARQPSQTTRSPAAAATAGGGSARPVYRW